MNHTWSIRVSAALLTPIAALTALPTLASADPHPAHDKVVGGDPSDDTPNVLDGHVSAFAQVGDTMIAGGEFTQVEQDGAVYDRSNVFAFSAATGEVLDDFAPVVDGEVADLAVTPDERAVLLVGSFDSVAGRPQTAKVALVRVADGAVDPSFDSPTPDGRVRDVVAAGGLYYIAGAFKTLDGRPHGSLAALDPDGSIAGVRQVEIDGTNSGGSTSVRSMDVSPDGRQLLIAGNFATVDGRARAQIALLDISPTATTLAHWSTGRFAPECGPHFDTYMRDVAFAPSGRYFVVVTTGGPRGRQSSGLLCDSATRWETSAGPGADPTWIDYTGGDTLTAVIVDREAIYVGGHQRWLNNSRGRNAPGPGAVAREGIAALDPANGLPYSWDPGRRRGYGVYGFALTADGLWVGSDTIGFGGELHNRIAFCPVVDGTAVPAYETARLPGRLALLRRTGGVHLRAFDGRHAGPVTALASPSWASLRGSFVVDGMLYAAWEDGTMTQQSFDGEVLGPSDPVQLRGSFSDLSRVDAMFFDRANRRIYYTIEGRNRLFYRYFQPESGVVGTWRFAAPAGGPLDWSTVDNAVLAGRQLYFSPHRSRALRTARWGHTTAGASTRPITVLGPSIDGISYRAAGLALLS